MDRDQARDIAEGAREHYSVPRGAQAGSIVRQFIEVTDDGSEVPGPVRDVLAWIVRFKFESSWVDLAVAYDTGDIVRVKWSRGAVRRPKRGSLQ